MKDLKSHQEVKFKIFRDDKKRPTVIICVIKANGDTGTGMAIRSLRDNPVKKFGRDLAYRRAKIALYRRKNSLLVHRAEAYEPLLASGAIGFIPNPKTEIFKSYYMRDL